MIKKSFLVYIILQLFFESSKAQDLPDSIMYIGGGPIEKGYILKYKENLSRYQDPANYITIYSEYKDVFSISNGKVRSIREMKEGFMMLIENGDTLFVYANLDNPNIKVNAEIKAGQKIGTILLFKKKSYELVFSILFEKNWHSSLNYIELFDFLTKKYGYY